MSRITLPCGLKTEAQSNNDEHIDEPFDGERKKLRYHEDVWVHYIRLGLLVFGAILTFSVVFVYLWHLIGPAKWCWLTPEEHLAIKDIAMAIIVGLVMSSLTSYFFKKSK